MRMIYVTNNPEPDLHHVFEAIGSPPRLNYAMFCEDVAQVVLWCEEKFGPTHSTSVTRRWCYDDSGQGDLIQWFYVLDERDALEFRLRWC